MSRTSTSYPLDISAVSVPGFPGRIGMTLCPGKHQDDSATGRWARDLQVDLDAIVGWGARALVCLVEQHELEALDVPGLGEAARGAGLEFHHLPIPDADVPDSGFEALWTWSGARVRARLERGEAVVVHCKGGLGRTGLVAARLLVELGAEPARAVARVRAARPGTIETEAQRRRVLEQRTAPGDRHRQEERIQPGVVESLPDVATRGKGQTLFVFGDRLRLREHLPPPFKRSETTWVTSSESWLLA